MNGTAEGGSLQRLAYELSVSALRHQETSLTELRERTGTLLAASSIVASFLGARALDDGFGALTVFGLLAFVLSVFTSVYVLFPKASFIFALRGSVLFEEELSDPGGTRRDVSQARLLARGLPRFEPDDHRAALPRVSRGYIRRASRGSALEHRAGGILRQSMAKNASAPPPPPPPPPRLGIPETRGNGARKS
jgi:hypothetical protein